MEQNNLNKILRLHEKWINKEIDGRRADLSGADLSGANLSGANLDLASWPLWCGTKDVKVDVRIARQIAAHFCCLDLNDKEYQKARLAVLDFAGKSHIASRLLEIQQLDKEGEK